MEKNENVIIEEFTRNTNGVKIKKCCASCSHKEPYDSEGPRRMCTLNKEKKIIRKDDLCLHWSISPDIDRIKIKCRIL